MTLSEAAAYLGVAQSSIYGWTCKKKIPFRKVGRLLKFNRQELEAWTMAGNEPLIRTKKKTALIYNFES